MGPALGQRGINIMEFCKAFNARTQEMEVGQPTPVIITYFTDKSFTMEIKTPPASFLLKKAAGVVLGVEDAGQGGGGVGDAGGARQIAETKMKDLNANDVEAAMQIIAGSARSMGIEVKG